MASITDEMQNHHKVCDDEFAAAEEAARGKDWAKAEAAFARFHQIIEAHFATEEKVIFPAFEQRSGMFGGPTQVMRTEHTQMRGLLGQMADAVKQKDRDGYAGAADTLLVMMQQHNLKEENILYPMCDQVLSGDVTLMGEIAAGLEAGA